jgi:hypothetical protein
MKKSFDLWLADSRRPHLRTINRRPVAVDHASSQMPAVVTTVPRPATAARDAARGPIAPAA